MKEIAPRRRRGEPLVVMAIIGMAWIGARVALWEAPIGGEAAQARVVESATPLFAFATPGQREGGEDLPGAGLEIYRPTRMLDLTASPSLRSPARAATPAASVVQTAAAPRLQSFAPATLSREASPSQSPHQSAMPRAAASLPQAAKRWRVDAWMAWRPGGGLPQVAAGAPLALAYGGSQGGLVARFDLGTGDRRPQAYLRAVHAPARPAQSDLAIGAGLRPLAALPLRVQGEARLTRTSDDTLVRPAILAVTELRPADLPLGLRGEAYAQAGWVGGRYATGFVDGQARVDRALASLGPAEVRLGAGAWGGAQKFVSRFDVGPSLTLDLRREGVPARLSIDYRKRVAGNARPGDGVAVTLSTGF